MNRAVVVIAVAVIAAGAGGGVALARSSGSASAAHATAVSRVPGDNGKLLPTVSCWIQVEGASPGGDVSVLSVVNPNGGRADCPSVISELNDSLDGYAASATTALSADEMDPANVACAGMYSGYRVTTVVTYAAGSMDPGGAACQALGLSG